jgi:hypothetical protein
MTIDEKIQTEDNTRPAGTLMSTNYKGLTLGQELALDDALNKAAFVDTVQQKKLIRSSHFDYISEKRKLLQDYFSKFAREGSQDITNYSAGAVGLLFIKVYDSERKLQTERIDTITDLTRKIKY